MKVYLAAAWGRRLEILKIAGQLQDVGVQITSRWLIEEEGLHSGAPEKFKRERAYIDLADVDAADALVRFSDVPVIEQAVHDGWMEGKAPHVDYKLMSAARMVEMGYALAKGKTVYVVGGHQNVFDHLANVIHVRDVKELLEILSTEENVTDK